MSSHRYKPELPPKPFKVRVDAAGRVLLPAELRKQMGLKPGDPLLMRMTENGFMQAWTVEWAAANATRILRQYVPEGRMLSDELIADRRAEAAKEETEVEEYHKQRVLRERQSGG